MKPSLFTLTAAVATFGFAAAANAAILVEYELDDVDGPGGAFSTAPTQTIANASATGLTSSLDALAIVVSNGGGTTPSDDPKASVNAVAGSGSDRGIDFTLTAASGFELNVTDFTVFSRSGSTPAATNPETITLQYSLNGGTTFINASGPTVLTANYVQYTGPVGVTGEDSILFRVRGDFTGNQGRSFRFDDIVVNGEVIPEPASLALLGLGGLLLLPRRKRNA